MLIANFLKQVTLNNVLASTVKRFGLYAAEYGLMTLMAPAWIASPLRYTVMTTVGSASKNIFWWTITPNKKTPYLNEPLVFIGEEDDLNKLEFVVVNNTPSGYQLSYKSLPKKVKKMATGTINATGNYIINMTMADLMEGTGATIGSAAATGAFVIILGPPSLLSLPAYFLMEGPTKSFGAFCGRKFSKHVLGPNAVKPALRAAFGAKKIITKGEETELTTEELVATFEELTLTTKAETLDEIIESFEMILPPPPIIRYSSGPLNIIENYRATQSTSEHTPLKIT